MRRHGTRTRYIKDRCRCDACKDAQNSYMRDYKRTRAPYVPGSKRAEHLKRTYGLTLEAWDQLFERQGRACALCERRDPGSERGWHVDHDHVTDRIRGILCIRCNSALGALGDNAKGLAKALRYVTVDS